MSGVDRGRAWRRHLSVRTRAMLAFGLVSFALSGTLAIVTYSLVRASLIADREEAALRQAYTNARAVRTRVSTDTRNLTTFLAGLQLDSSGDVLLQRQGRWYASSVRADRSLLPPDVRQAAQQGHAARQIAPTTTAPVLVVGVPVAAIDATYYEITSIADLDRTLSTLATSLVLAALAAAAAGALTGALVSRSVVRPLRRISTVATEIAAGNSHARLVATGDPDLEPLASSFNGMIDELEERARREARFASDVAHDLRGPLTALSAAVSVVHGRRNVLPEEAAHAVDLLDQQVQAFNQLVLDLLDISRFESGTAVLQTRQVLVADLVRAVVSERATPIAIEDHGASDVAAVVDPRRLHQVLTNIFDNADNYAGGTSMVTVRPAYDGERRSVQIVIDDAGPGIAVDERTTVFDRFHRGRGGMAPGAPRGSGLGLALAAQHVALHGGRIWIEDAPAGGARFVIELPLLPAPHQPTEPGDVP